MKSARLHIEAVSNADYSGLHPNAKRTFRAVTERMLVVPQTRDDDTATGLYHVFSASGNVYLVDAEYAPCTCPDVEHNDPVGGCKHQRRVTLMLNTTSLPAPGEDASAYWDEFEERNAALRGEAEELIGKGQNLHELATRALDAAAEQR